MATERRAEVAGIGTRYWEVAGERPDHPVLFVHGNPTSADEWLPFLTRLEGKRRCLAFDLVGWGKSDRRPDFDHTPELLAWFVERFIDTLAIERFDMVVHDWGAVGLVPASWRPQSVGRIAIFDAVPLFAGYRWHRVARVWQTPLLGELMLMTMTRFGTTRLLRQASPKPGAPAGVADEIHRYLDGGMKRAMLQLYRSADPDRLAQLGSHLGDLECPALVVWGESDPYVGPENADRYAEVLGGEAEVVRLPEAGHWPWIDRPDAIDRVAAFLS
jgi:pimeloyl-ACP methyl ester carboxylesterase